MSKGFICLGCNKPMKKAMNTNAWVCIGCDVAVQVATLEDDEKTFPKVLEDKEIIGPMAHEATCPYCGERYQITRHRGGICAPCFKKMWGGNSG